MRIEIDEKEECVIRWKDKSESTYESFEIAVKEVEKELKGG